METSRRLRTEGDEQFAVGFCTKVCAPKHGIDGTRVNATFWIGRKNDGIIDG